MKGPLWLSDLFPPAEIQTRKRQKSRLPRPVAADYPVWLFGSAAALFLLFLSMTVRSSPLC